ncbi:MAG TPA: hypothetical protein VGF01_10270 [Terracidiphilus sp.]|jgi:type VI secretion system protein
MFDLTSSRRSRCHIVPYWPAAALLLCLTLPSCSGTKKIAKIATAATAPPAAPPAPAVPAAPAPPAPPAGPQAATPKSSLLKSIVSLLTLAPSPLELKVSIDPNANNDTPVELDVALINDKALWKTAPSMTAKDWFAQKSDLERRYQKKLTVSSWEWVPGQSVNPMVIRIPRWLNGAMVFANYPSPGTHSAPVAKGSKVAITLEQDDFTLEKSK